MRVFALGVKPEYQHTGRRRRRSTSSTSRRRRPDGIDGGETGWILETNEPMNRAMEGMGGKVVKQYRLYEQRARGRAALFRAVCANPDASAAAVAVARLARR